MRSIRAKYKGSYHHVYNRRLGKQTLFMNDDMRRYFLFIMYKAQMIYKVEIIGYCLMDTHYHLILKNQSNYISEFMRYLNGVYAGYLRREIGGKGFVFEDRFGSSLIQDDSYMINVIYYTMLNPCEAGIVSNPFDYLWSSINLYYQINTLKGAELVEDYFLKPVDFQQAMLYKAEHLEDVNLRIISADWGKFIGHPANIHSIFRKINKRTNTLSNSPSMRKDDNIIKRPKDIIREFEQKHSLKMINVNTHSMRGKKMRGELLILLKEEAALSYREIAKIDMFRDVRQNSLGKLYSYYKFKFSNSVPSK